MPIWFSVDGGNWNGSGTANPSTGVGGASLAAFVADTMYMTALINPANNDQLTFNFGASSFAYSAPSGFAAGVPNGSGGYTTFDPSKTVEATLSNGDLTVTNAPAQEGMAQTVAGFAYGSYYFEISCDNLHAIITDGATNFGVARAGADPSHLTVGTGGGNGTFSPGDVNGGAICSTEASPNFIAVSGTAAISGLPAIFTSNIVRVAVTFEGTPPAPTVVNDNPVRVRIGGTVMIYENKLEATGWDGVPANLLFTVDTPTAHGELVRYTPEPGGAWDQVSSFTQADINGGSLAYRSTGTEALTDSFTFTVVDNGSSATPVTTFDIIVMADPLGIQPASVPGVSDVFCVDAGCGTIVVDCDLFTTSIQQGRTAC